MATTTAQTLVCCEPKDRTSISTAATDNTSLPDVEDYSEASEIIEEDLVEFDELEKDLLLCYDEKRKIKRQNSLLSVSTSSDSSTKSGSLRSTRSENRRSSRSSRSPKPNRSPKPTRSPRVQRSATATSVLSREQDRRVKLRMRRALTLESAPVPKQSTEAESVEASHQTPAECLREVLHGVCDSALKSETWEKKFTAITPDRLAGYTEKATHAIRSDQLSAVKQLHGQGISFDTCNQHGESMIHFACRSGQLEIIKFLVDDAKVPLRVRDDAGRTPLHDLCWTNKPDFGLMKYILSQAPELLFIKDKRGFTAFQYIPQGICEQWCQFLRDEQAFLLHQVKESAYHNARHQLDDAQERLQALMKRAASFD
ncbi:ANK [Seminavis robusta]|uniref:ANK n=1 Tax=Seminavis robusta TaxID=568900 RepID=A0A9N8H3Z5_9STRA|nr:ANK [Seminavis robusta]|eukprot:Sro100_g051330.1 ANK (370) ;mRNA; r:80024-81133